jgi:diadenosine tetraphosphate (Ap4A) HIT family hydrolase
MNEADCPFCVQNIEKLLPATARESNDSAFAIYPIGQVTSDQFLVAPLQHHVVFEKLEPSQIIDMHNLSCEWINRSKLGVEELRGIAGNFGEAAGQTVPHLHIHFPNFDADTIRFGGIENALRNELKPSGISNRKLARGHFSIASESDKYIEIGNQQIVDLFSKAGNQMVSLIENDDTIRGFNLYANEEANRGSKKSKRLIFNFIPRRFNDMENESDRRGGCMSSLKRQFAAHNR